MAIRVISPFDLDEGHLVELNENGTIKTNVLGGQVVKLKKGDDGENHIVPSVDTDTLAAGFPYGFCYKASVEQPANALYTSFNQYKAPADRQSVILTKGFRAELWNDGTGKVFEADVFNAEPGTPLYVSSSGTLTKTANGTETNVGAMVVAVVEKAPADANGVLVIHAQL